MEDKATRAPRDNGSPFQNHRLGSLHSYLIQIRGGLPGRPPMRSEASIAFVRPADDAFSFPYDGGN